MIIAVNCLAAEFLGAFVIGKTASSAESDSLKEKLGRRLKLLSSRSGADDDIPLQRTCKSRAVRRTRRS